MILIILLSINHFYRAMLLKKIKGKKGVSAKSGTKKLNNNKEWWRSKIKKKYNFIWIYYILNGNFV